MVPRRVSALIRRLLVVAALAIVVPPPAAADTAADIAASIAANPTATFGPSAYVDYGYGSQTPASPPPAAPPQPELPPPAPTPAAAGYERPDLTAAVAVAAVMTVFCRTDAAWPTEPALKNATGYWTWGGSTLTMRTWRCDGVAREKIGSELFARGLFVLAHEAAHAEGLVDECDADKRALATMGAITARLGWGFAAGDDAGRYLNELLRPNPPPPPYCIGRL